MNFFPYSWHNVDNEIHVYCFQEDKIPVLLKLEDFTPYIYIKLPTYLNWTEYLVSKLKRKFENIALIVRTKLLMKNPLYYSHIKFGEETFYKEKVPYLFVSFQNDMERKKFIRFVKPKYEIIGIGNIPIEIYEHNATPVLQLTVLSEISTADWFHVRKVEKVDFNKHSKLKYEYRANWRSLQKTNIVLDIPQPLIMSWDIECYSHDPNKFSDGTHTNDTVFQISCIFGRQSTPKNEWESYLLTLGIPDESKLLGVKVISFKSEFKLLLGFRDLIVEKNPQILLGYNIFKFDIPFLYKRACLHMIQDDFTVHGCTAEKCKIETIKWSSSAYSNQEMNFFDLKGRITIDLLTLVQRDFNLDNYKLNFIARKFLNAEKDPLTHLDIFLCYKRGMIETREIGKSISLSIVGKYCVKDSMLVLELFEKFQYWYSLTEMAKICQVPHSHLFLYGQQLKVFSQVYRHCYHENIVVESGLYKTSPDDFCSGASVLEPVPGLYDDVVSFDFASLYPSIIISHNIDFTTLVKDESIPDEMCHIIDWEEHINCDCPNATKTGSKKDEVRCTTYKFRWLKSPIGVLPTIIKNLLDARKQVRKQMKEIDKNSLLYDILNKRQLAYKVSSNSMYGALTTKKGYLPFLPGGMCICAVGRKSIHRVSEIIKKDHGGKIIYGDTDSNYVVFPHLKSREEIWKHSIYVSEEVSKHFLDPMKLEFEDNIYTKYLILSKKRYLYYSSTESTTKLDHKGVLLKRRDNSVVVRNIYEKIIRMIMDGYNENDIIYTLLSQIDIMFSLTLQIDDFQMSKSVKEIQKFDISYRDAKTIRFGDYCVPRIDHLPQEEKEKLYEKKGVNNAHDFYISNLDGHVRLALRMRSRGQNIESGSRLSFVVTKKAPHKSSVGDRMEETEYFKTHYNSTWIDVLHYLHLLSNPMDEVLTVIYGTRYKKFVESIYKYKLSYDKVITELFHLFHPLQFEGVAEKKQTKKKTTTNKTLLDLWK